jgi:CRP/FNR family cyclic AMP-dependent transcriptional regulator
MIERFAGKLGQKRLLTALASQGIIQNNSKLVAELAKKVTLEELESGNVLITQGESDNDIYFILAGKFRIVVNGRDIAIRTSSSHVGEMSLLDVSEKRSATAIASEKSVVAKVTENDFTRLANKYPKLWRNLAIELSKRLRERDRFIASSSNMLPIAQEIQSGLSHDNLIIKVWTDGVFQPSSVVLDDLIREVQLSDFGVLVLGQDDKIISRGSESWAPRDNVVFEMGMLVSVLGKARTFIIKPKSKPLKIPSDLLGITPIEYDLDEKEPVESQLAPVCNTIRKAIKKLGSK